MRRRGRKVRPLSFILLLILSCLFLESASPPESSARILKTSVPICETIEEWTGKWLIVGQETVPQEYPCLKAEIVPEHWVTTYVLEQDTAYRVKYRLVEKVAYVATEILKKVTTWVKKVRSWLERTWLGKWVKKVATWLEPVTKWVRETVWKPVVRKVWEEFMEPYPVWVKREIKKFVPAQKTMVPSTCVEYVTRPIKVRETIQYKDVVWRTMEIEARNIPAWVINLLFQRFYIQKDCVPVEDRLQVIYATWSEFKTGLTAYRYGHLDPEYRDEFLIFLDGLPHEAYLGRFPMLGHGFGAGPGAWQDFTAPEANAAQYFQLNELAEAWGWDDAGEYGSSNGTHYNLCGELAVIGAVGDAIPEGLTLFKDEVDGGMDILKNNKTTHWSDLIDFFIKYEWGPKMLTGCIDQKELAKGLRNGAVVALVNLSKVNEILEPGEGNNYTAHWVTVLQVLKTKDGLDAVRVYNSFENRDEYYTWDYFHDVWERTNGNSSTCLRVTAWWLPWST